MSALLSYFETGAFGQEGGRTVAVYEQIMAVRETTAAKLTTFSFVSKRTFGVVRTALTLFKRFSSDVH